MNSPVKKHQPIHVFIDNEIYFLTVRIFENRSILTEMRKKELLNEINNLFLANKYSLFAYAVLENHYHLLFKISEALLLSKILNKLYGFLSYKWNKEDNLQGRKIFQNYWDYCIRDEKDFWTHFNYIHQNPIKHRFANNLEDLKDYKYCSYRDYLAKYGQTWLMECFTEYPVKDFIAGADEIKP